MTPLWRVIVDAMFAGRFDVEAIELGSTTILGRDVLNSLSVHLNGPKKQLSVL